MPPDAVYCSACGEPLGDPQEVLHDPDGKSDVAQGVAGGPISNPNSHHIKVVDGPGDQKFRYQCASSGQMTKLTDQPPNQQESQAPSQSQEKPTPPPSDGEPTQPQQNQPNRPPPDDVYEVTPDQDAMDILQDVVTNEAYGLNDGQIKEVNDWGEIYDGQIPPDKLEAVLQNLSGVSNQKAKLMREKYEAKISKWVRQKSEENSGPRIGAHSGRMVRPGMGGNGGGQQPSPSPQPSPQPQPEPPSEKEQKPSTPRSERKSKRERRVERRQEALDKAVDRAAEEMARNFAQDFGTFFTDAREIMTTVMRKKAESDPEWFFEKMEKWDMDLFDEVMSASETKQEEQKEKMSQADLEIDEALASMEEEPEDLEPPTKPDPDEVSSSEDSSPSMMEAAEDYVGDQIEEEAEEDIEDEEVASLLDDMEAQ